VNVGLTHSSTPLPHPLKSLIIHCSWSDQPIRLCITLAAEPQQIGLFLQNLIVTRIVKKFLAFYGTRKFITVSTRAHRWSVTWASWIQSTPCLFKIHFLSSSHLHLGFGSCLFYSGFKQRPGCLWGPVVYPGHIPSSTMATVPSSLHLVPKLWKTKPYLHSPCLLHGVVFK
jgi:hypothetical protein